MSLTEFIAARNAMLEIEKKLYVAEIWGDMNYDGGGGRAIETPEGIVVTHHNKSSDDPYMNAVSDSVSRLIDYCMQFKNIEWEINRNGEICANGIGKRRDS